MIYNNIKKGVILLFFSYTDGKEITHININNINWIDQKAGIVYLSCREKFICQLSEFQIKELLAMLKQHGLLKSKIVGTNGYVDEQTIISNCNKAENTQSAVKTIDWQDSELEKRFSELRGEK